MFARVARGRFGGLWRHPDFLKLWGGQTVSVFGSLVTKVILPLVAVLTLDASQAQVALLYIADAAPALALGLAAGALADRVRRRPLLIAADVGRALALLAVPLAAALGGLSLGLLYAVSVATSALSVLFDIAYPAYLATLVGEKRLVEGNAKLGASLSVAEVAGFGAAGALAQALTAPVAVLVDAATYVVSVISLALIRAPEPHPQPAAERPKLIQLAREVAEGLRLTWAHPARRAIAGAGAINALCGSLLETALVIFILRDLDISPALMGLSFGVGGVAAFVGAVATERVTARLGLARTLRWSAWVSRGLGLLIPLAGGPIWLAFALITIPQLGDAAYTIYDISATSALQLVTPSRALGRVVASGSTLRSAGSLVGLALGATAGAALGPRGTLGVAMVGMLLGPLLLSLTPMRDGRLTGSARAPRIEDGVTVPQR
ncbi:MAG TPA: MFS transporter [Ktedonobacterales bacterium]|nr:MFS transporter [Ktedonobacterales bacterium]